MTLLKRPARPPSAATSPFGAWRRWFGRHPRRFNDVAPHLVCRVCGARTRLTPELDARLVAQPVPCGHCGRETFRREW